MSTDFRRFLLICSGNICRSPMAEYYLRARLPDEGGWGVASAGLGALVGHPADDKAIAVMAQKGIDLSAHRARQFDVEAAKEYDLILAMEGGQVRWIVERYPFLRGRVQPLGHWTGQDVPDPYRRPEAAFIEARERVIAGVDSWLGRLLPEAGQGQTPQ